MFSDLDLEPEGEVERLYQICYERGYVNSALEFTMISHYMKRKNYKTAKPLLDNGLLRNPNDKELITYRLHIAREEDDQETIKLLEKSPKSLSQNRINLSAVHQ